jgi:hypothetical protein
LKEYLHDESVVVVISLPLYINLTGTFEISVPSPITDHEIE